MSAVPDRALLAEVAGGLSRHAGLRFNLGQPSSLWQAIQSRLRAHRLADAQAYLRRLREDKTEWSKLAEAAAIHETSFFRQAGQFRVLSEAILPEMMRSRAPDRRLRLWSAGCATGEEPYSLAIAVHRLDLPADWRVTILGTDLSARALAIAEKALFTERRLRPLSPEISARYFEPYGDRFRLRDEIRSLVTFSQFNLSQGGPLPDLLCAMDIVFCRNVLIYFVPEAVRQAIDHLRAALRDGGHLFLGYAETLHGMSAGFVAIPFEDTYVYRRQAQPPAAPTAPSKRTPPVRTAPPPKPTAGRPTPTEPLLRPTAASPELQRTVQSHIDGGDLSGASRHAQRWLSLEPDSSAARFTLARLYAAQDRDAEAAQLLRELLARDSLHAQSYVLLGMLCSRQGDMAEAAALFQHAIYLEPGTPLPHFLLGNIFQEQGQLRQAMRAYQQVLRLHANFVPEWDSGFTPELLVQVCKRSIDRLEKVEKAQGEAGRRTPASARSPQSGDLPS